MEYVEKDCTIQHEGRSFESGGAIVTPDFIVAYPGKRNILQDWNGKEIGTWHATASWPVRSFMGNTMYQIRATVEGVVYTGRGMGEGMIFRGKAKKGGKA